MNEIFKKQAHLQSKLRPEFAALNCDKLSTVGETYDALLKTKFYLNEEITELMEALGDGTRDIHKPWKDACKYIRQDTFESAPKIREEAIDMLCFAINICLIVGLDHNNINRAYHDVYGKNIDRMTEIASKGDK